MNTATLSRLGAGFSDAARGSQAVFRAALHALSHPGRVVPLTHDAQVPSPGHGASAALLLALLDPDCTLWLAPSLADSDAAAWLRFHTGCVLVQSPADARFAWATQAHELPPLADFAQGSDEYPDQSTTCVLDVAGLTETPTTAGWTLRGPGIREQARLGVAGLAPAFSTRLRAEWAANHAGFPRGVDLLLATPTHIAGLPRTTRIEMEA